MKILVMIQARMASTRFYGKALAPLFGLPVLSRVIRRCQQMPVGGVWLLTSREPEDRILRFYAEYHGIPCQHEGNVPLQVLDWYEAAAQIARPEYILRVCGDAPYIDVELTRALVEHLRANPGADYYGYRMADGTPCEVLSFGVFPAAFRWPLRAPMRGGAPYMQHVTLGIYTQPERYTCEWLSAPAWAEATPFKATVDVPEDIARLEALGPHGSAVELARAVAQHPEMAGDVHSAMDNVRGMSLWRAS